MSEILTGIAIGALAVIVPAAVTLTVCMLVMRAPRRVRGGDTRAAADAEGAADSFDAQMDELLNYDGRVKRQGDMVEDE